MSSNDISSINGGWSKEMWDKYRQALEDWFFGIDK